MGRPNGKYAWTATVGEKGQIVIPKAARDMFDIQPGDTLLLLADINQGIDSHDGMDTDTRTLRLEREQNGTDVAPSKVREESEQSREASHDDGRGYSLDSEARDMRSASKQLEHESGAAEREIDISDKMSQVR